MRTASNLALALAAAVLLGACGGGGGDSASPNPPAPQNASLGGIWEGTTSTGSQVLGLIAETGEFHFLQDDGIQYFGTASTSQNSVSGTFTGVTELGTAFLDGSTSGTGTLSGTVQARASLTGSTSFRTAGGSQSSATVNLTYNTLYERDSSLATVSGNFREVGGTDIASITSTGDVFLQEPSTGCTINGKLSIVDARYNAYRVEYTFASCQGQYAVLNGATFRGLATLNNTTSPEQLIGGVTATVNGVGISLALIFERT